MGDSGASTQKQIKNFEGFRSKTQQNVKYVIHQYFGNDIEDYITMTWVEKRGRISKGIGKISLVYDFIMSWLHIREFSPEYSKSIFEAYSSEEKASNHLNDIRELHEKIRKENANVVMVVFPFLQSKEQIHKSQIYIDKLKIFFINTCSLGDVFIDVSGAALSVPNDERVASFIDAHPSEKLHELVVESIMPVISQSVIETDDFFIQCNDV